MLILLIVVFFNPAAVAGISEVTGLRDSGDGFYRQGRYKDAIDHWQQALTAAVPRTEANVAVDPAVAELAEKRATARSEKNWALSDQLRDQISALGWQVADTPDGQQLTPVN